MITTSTSLSIIINPPPFLSSTAKLNTFFCSFFNTFSSSSLLSTSRKYVKKSSFGVLVWESSRERSVVSVGGEKEKGMSITEEDGGPLCPLLEETKRVTGQRRIILFVEPSPFSHVSGYKNRFQNFIKYLREMGDEVMVVTTHEGVPEEFHGAKLVGSWSFPLPWYKTVPLSLALSPRIIMEVANFKPDIIHTSSPGVMVFRALMIAKMLSVPIVMSYHTHVPIISPPGC